MSEPNVQLDALIEEARLSHAGFAARVNELGGRRGIALYYDHASIARWIRDHAIPRGDVPEIICEVISARLGRPVTLAMAGLDRSRGDRIADAPLPQVIDRAAAFWRSEVRSASGSPERSAVVSGPAAIAPVFEWENPPDDLDVSSQRGHRMVTVTDVIAVREARARYEEMYRRVGGVPVFPRVIGFLNGHVAPLLRESYDNATGQQLMRAAGGIVAIAGICLYDADRQAAAQRYFFDSLRLAKASGDRGFGGYVVALLANPDDMPGPLPAGHPVRRDSAARGPDPAEPGPGDRPVHLAGQGLRPDGRAEGMPCPDAPGRAHGRPDPAQQRAARDRLRAACAGRAAVRRGAEAARRP